jgi:hypothetical protein
MKMKYNRKEIKYKFDRIKVCKDYHWEKTVYNKKNLLLIEWDILIFINNQEIIIKS